MPILSSPLSGRSGLGPNDLILSHFSMRDAGFDDRCAAAAAGGFAAIGLYFVEYLRLRNDEGRTDADLAAVLARYDVRLLEIEAVRLSELQTEGLDHPAVVAGCRMADAFGADHFQVIGPYLGSIDDGAAALAGLCDRLAEHGVRAAVEFLPEMSNIPDAACALDLVERTGRANAGLCVDSWHHFRGAADWSLLERIPGERVVCIQFDDGPAERTSDDYLTDTFGHRLVPGEGDFDLERFLRTMHAIGASVPISVEVIDYDLDPVPAVDIGRRLGDSTRRVLAASRS